MDCELDFPIKRMDGNVTYVAQELAVRATIEADESVGCSEWYIARIEILGRAIGAKTDDWFDVADTDPLFEEIQDHALRHHRDVFEEMFAEYLRDEAPELYRDRYSADGPSHRERL